MVGRRHALSVGESLSLVWPARLTIRPGGSSRRASTQSRPGYGHAPALNLERVSALH